MHYEEIWANKVINDDDDDDDDDDDKMQDIPSLQIQTNNQ